jgi:hypothetical protein
MPTTTVKPKPNSMAVDEDMTSYTDNITSTEIPPTITIGTQGALLLLPQTIPIRISSKA